MCSRRSCRYLPKQATRGRIICKTSSCDFGANCPFTKSGHSTCDTFSALNLTGSPVFLQPLTWQVEVQSILGAVEDHSLCSGHLSQQVVHHLKKPKCKKPRRRDRACLEKYTDSPATATSETHIVVRPQLQTTGADAEHAGEELLRFKEVRCVKVLRQARELFAELSRFLQERRESSCSYDLQCTPQKSHQAPFFVRLKVFFVPFGHPPQANEGSSSHPETKPSSFSLKEYICVFYYVFSDPHLTQEEVRVFLLWCSSHKFIKWQSPVNVEHMTSVEIYCCLCVYIYHCEDVLALCSFKELCDTQSWFNKMLYS